jgi:hypothetical protein
VAARALNLAWSKSLTDADVARLAGPDDLERVDLLGTATGDGAIEALAGRRALRHFKSGTQVTEAGLDLFHDFPAFKTWQGGDVSYSFMRFDADPTYLLLHGAAPFSTSSLSRLVGLDGLFALNLDNPAWKNVDLAPLRHLPNLGWLGHDATDGSMQHIAGLPRLRFLMCQDTAAGDEGFEALSHSRTLEHIWGRRCYNLTGRGFTALSTMPALLGLGVSCRNVDDEALSTLPRFPALRALMPMDVPDAGFRHVGRCEGLEALWCMYCRDTTDAATEHIGGLSRLKTYYAGSTLITNRTLEILSEMPSLETIRLEYCAGITDAGAAKLAALPRLRELTLDGCAQITAQVTAAFPNGVQVTIA